jgi:hypothetical protein
MAPAMNEPLNAPGNEAVPAQPRTALGKQLSRIRDRIIASGEPLLSWNEVEEEIADRRGEAERRG